MEHFLNEFCTFDFVLPERRMARKCRDNRPLCLKAAPENRETWIQAYRGISKARNVTFCSTQKATT
jgi:hypothetical protein